MREPTLVPTDDAAPEAIATAGLFLIVTAVIAMAVGVSCWGLADGLLAALAGVIAATSFAASIVCFRAQTDEREQRTVG